MTGIKHDGGKYRHSLLPQGVLQEVIKVLEHGANKYAPDNWKKVPDARTRYYDAAHRHMDQYWAGEMTDPDTDLHHLAHAICSLMFIVWLDENAQTNREVPEMSAAKTYNPTTNSWIIE